jgi:hypothetical protein
MILPSQMAGQNRKSDILIKSVLDGALALYFLHLSQASPNTTFFIGVDGTADGDAKLHSA